MIETFDVQIRLATPADLPSLASLLYNSFAEYKSFYTDEGFAATTPSSDQLLQRMNEGPLWVSTRDGAAIGTVSAVDRGDYLYIRGMAVLPEARAIGLGTLLLRTVEEFAVARGHKHLTLSTTPFLDHAIRLYECAGFRRTVAGPHDLYGTPLFTMVKDLL